MKIQVNIPETSQDKPGQSPEHAGYPKIFETLPRGGVEIQFFDGATAREAVTLTLVDTVTLEADGELKHVINGCLLTLNITVPPEEGEEAKTYDLNVRVDMVQYDFDTHKSTINLIRTNDSFINPTCIPDGATLNASYYWKDVVNWDGAAGTTTTLYQPDDLDVSPRPWMHKPISMSWLIKQEAMSQGGDATTEYGPDNDNRWQRKPLEGSYTQFWWGPNVPESRYGYGYNYWLGDPWQEVSPGWLPDWAPTVDDGFWLLGMDFVNLLVRLKRSETDNEPKFEANPDTVRNEETKKLKQLEKDNKYGFLRKGTITKKYFLSVSEISSRSTCHYLNLLGDIGERENVCEYAYDRLQMKIRLDGEDVDENDEELWQSANLFYHWFDSSDTTNFKVTTGPTYASQEVSGKFLDVGKKWEVYLMPRKYGYSFTSRKGTHNYEQYYIEVDQSYIARCNNGYEQEYVNPCGHLVPWRAYYDTYGPFERNYQGTYQFSAGRQAYCEDTVYPPVWCYSTGLEPSIYETEHNVFIGWTVLGWECSGWCDPYGGYNNCTAADDIVMDGGVDYSNTVLRLDHQYGIFWDRWPSNFNFRLQAKMPQNDDLFFGYGLEDGVWGLTQYYGEYSSSYPEQMSLWRPLHYIPSELKATPEDYDGSLGETLDEYEPVAYSRYSELSLNAPTTENWYYKHRYNPSTGGTVSSSYPRESIPAAEARNTDSLDYGGFGQFWLKIEDHDLWQELGTPSFNASTNKYSRWDSIPYACWLSPAKEGTLCAVVRKKGSGKAYFIWRKTDEEFRLSIVSKDENYQGHIVLPQWMEAETPSEKWDGDTSSTYQDPDTEYYGMGIGEVQHNLTGGVSDYYVESEFGWGDIEQFYSANGLREATHVGRAWELSRVIYPAGCTDEWARQEFYKMSAEPTAALDSTMYMLFSKERALLDAQKHEDDSQSLATGEDRGLECVEGISQPYDPSERFVREVHDDFHEEHRRVLRNKEYWYYYWETQ